MLDMGKPWGPLQRALPEGHLGTPSALSSLPNGPVATRGPAFPPRLWHSRLPGNGEFSFIPIIRVPGQTNSLIQMSPGPQSHSLLGFSLYF